MADFQRLPPSTRSSVLAVASLVAIAGCLYQVVYRLYLSPLAKFPGPKLAALTTGYQFWFDVVKRGKLPWELIHLHEKYGPIIRIGPNELHVSDPEFYDVLYTGSSQRRDKDIFAINGFGLAKSVIATEKHDHHRLRRSALNPFFSTQAVTKLEPMLRAKLETLSIALARKQSTGEPVSLDAAMLALTTDIITEYSFARSYGFLDKPNFSPEWGRTMQGAAEASMLFRYVPAVIEIVKVLPPWLVKLMDPNLMQLISIKLDQEAQVKTVIADKEAGVRSSENKTIFHELLDSGLPAPEKTIPRLAEEAQIVLTAGSSTTVYFLMCTIYFVLAEPAILQRLKAELEKAIPDPSSLPPVHVLEQLPYLSAVVKEGSRINDGASSRLARIAPDVDLKYGEYIIPRGTSVSMSTYIQHRNTDLFPDPERFDPDRWLGVGRLDRYLVNFSKGTRNCLGMNLARAELFLTMAMVFRRFNLELFETDRSDVDMAHDFFVPHARLDSKGVRVTVKHCYGT